MKLWKAIQVVTPYYLYAHPRWAIRRLVTMAQRVLFLKREQLLRHTQVEKGSIIDDVEQVGIALGILQMTTNQNPVVLKGEN